MTLSLVYCTVPFLCAGTPFSKTKVKTNKFKRYWVYPFEVWHEFVLKKNNGRKEKKVGKKRVWNDKYPFEACATGCYPLRQYFYWGSLLFILAIQKGSLYQLRRIEFDFGRPKS